MPRKDASESATAPVPPEAQAEEAAKTNEEAQVEEAVSQPEPAETEALESTMVPKIHVEKVEATLDAQDAESEPPTPQTKCPEGHDLMAFETPEEGYLCSVCECEFSMGTTLYGCRPCDYDLCRDCVGNVAVHSTGFRKDCVVDMAAFFFGESNVSLCYIGLLCVFFGKQAGRTSKCGKVCPAQKPEPQCC